MIIAYTNEQMADIRRFSAVDTPSHVRSVVGVDRTFNLGPCYITVNVVENMSVLRKDTGDHPVFVGPTMFHFDGKQDTYGKFFTAMRDALAMRWRVQRDR